MSNTVPERRPGTGPTATSKDATDVRRGGPDDGDGGWGSDHAVNIRLSVPLVFWKFYVTIVGGPERRGVERQQSERGKHPMGRLGNVIILSYSGIVLLLALSAVIIGAGAVVIGQVFEIGLTLR